MNRAVVPVAVAGAVLVAAAFVFLPEAREAPRYVAASTPAPAPSLLPLSANVLGALNPFGLTEPIAQFRQRTTLKTFGMYITPDTSPVANDRFTGFHAGVDVEFTDTAAEVPVVAIADGTVTLARRVNGYGGVVVARHDIGGTPMFVLYGHLDPASLVAAGTRIAAGERLGVLGDDHSVQTDGVRKHLHLSFYTGATMDYRGYVPTEADLAPWTDPLDYF